MGTLQIDVLGASFAIRANEDEDYLKKLLNYYKKIASQIEQSGTLKDQMQISILAGIMICDELYKEKSKSAQLSKNTPNSFDTEAEKITIELIKKIDQALLA